MFTIEVEYFWFKDLFVQGLVFNIFHSCKHEFNLTYKIWYV